MRYYSINSVFNNSEGDGLTKPSIITSEETNVVINKLQPSTAYVYGTLLSLDINSVVQTTAESTIEFTAGENFVFGAPASLQTVGDLSFIAGKKYILAIYNNIMAIGELN